MTCLSDRPLVFGIYPGSTAGIDAGNGIIDGPADQPPQIEHALNELQQSAGLFLVRAYIQYRGRGNYLYPTPDNFQQYLKTNRLLDLVLCYRTDENDLASWVLFVNEMIERYGPQMYSIQITEEPNNPDARTGGEGSFLNVKEAIITGVNAARQKIEDLGAGIKVGFNAVPSFDQNDQFWHAMSGMITPEFRRSLNYIGLDFYPDVFRPLPPGMAIATAVNAVIGNFRNVNLKIAGIDLSTPLHITENGWPTAPGRSEEVQAATINEVITAVLLLKDDMNIAAYSFFNLRDSNTASADFQYGLLRSDYSPKPAFAVFQRFVSVKRRGE